MTNESQPTLASKPKWRSLIGLLLGIVIAIAIIVFIQWQQPKATVSAKRDGSLLSSFQVQKTTNRQDSFCALLDDKQHNACLGNPIPLCEKDLAMAKVAWQYFENNYNPTTGFYNAADNYPSTTMWDTGSALAATIAAYDFGFIDDYTFDERVNTLFKTLTKLELFNKDAPNKVYNTDKAEMVDYRNKPAPEGIGVSALDLARLISWLNTLSCMHPKYAYPSKKVIERWNLKKLIKDEQMYGLMLDPVSKSVQEVQEGRLGYEQYAGKIFRELGYSQNISATYNNQFRETVNIYDVPIAYDRRDPRDLGAYNYVVTESYVLDAIENGLDEENTPLLKNIYQVQKRRWEETGIITAVSEDNIDQPPYFLYNTIFTAGLPWNTTTDTGVRHDDLKTVSTKAAFSLALLFPEDPYSKQLAYMVGTAYDPKRGWYSGVYENGGGYNKVITANTNGIIMSLLLYKRYGEFYQVCKSCKRKITLSTIPKTSATCDVCSIK